MPDRCVVYGCSNEGTQGGSITFHHIPYWADTRPKAKARKKQWIDFVRRRRDRWEPTRNSVICSKHFLPEDYNNMFLNLGDQSSAIKPRLRRDQLGICVIPSIQTPLVEQGVDSLSARSRRMVSNFFYSGSQTVTFEVIFYLLE